MAFAATTVYVILGADPICSGGGDRVLHLDRALAASSALERVEARRVARLRVRVRDPHRRARVAHRAGRLRARRPAASASARGVVPIYTRTPATMAQTAATLDELSDGRFTLGLGVSHRPVVEGWHGRRSTGRWPRCASTWRSCARSCAARTRRAGRSGRRASTSLGLDPRPAAADLHRRPLPRDAAPRRRDRRRRDPVAVQSRATSEQVVMPELSAGRERAGLTLERLRRRRRGARRR